MRRKNYVAFLDDIVDFNKNFESPADFSTHEAIDVVIYRNDSMIKTLMILLHLYNQNKT